MRHLIAGGADDNDAMLIEADDPVLAAKAREITAGAVDSWQAATRIARWVSTA